MCIGVYLSSAVAHGSHSTAMASKMYTTVTFILNPFIYSLRNEDFNRALKIFVCMEALKRTFLLELENGTLLHGLWTHTEITILTALPFTIFLLFQVILSLGSEKIWSSHLSWDKVSHNNLLWNKIMPNIFHVFEIKDSHELYHSYGKHYFPQTGNLYVYNVGNFQTIIISFMPMVLSIFLS